MLQLRGVAVVNRAQRVLKVLDDEGRSIPLAEWIELLEEVVSEAQSRLDAAREDASHG